MRNLLVYLFAFFPGLAWAQSTDITFDLSPLNEIRDSQGNLIGSPEFGPFTVAFGYFGTSPANILTADRNAAEFNRLLSNFTILAQTNTVPSPGTMQGNAIVDLTQAFAPAGPIAGREPAIWIVKGIEDLSPTVFSDPSVESTLLMVLTEEVFPAANLAFGLIAEFGIDFPADTDTLFYTGTPIDAGAGIFQLVLEPFEPGPNEAAMVVTGNDFALNNLPAEVYNGTDFGGVNVGDSLTRSFEVVNISQSTLSFGTVQSNNEAFGVGFSISSLGPGDSAFLEVNFSPETEGPIEASIALPSNALKQTPYRFKVAGIGLAAPAQNEDSVLAGSDAAGQDDFGFAVAYSGDFAVVGAPGVDDDGSRSGAASIFERQTDGSWAEEAKLLPLDLGAGDEFGASVAIDGDLVVAGAPFQDGTGSAYVFRRDEDGTWSEEAKLVPLDAADGDEFGFSVSISGETIFVGAPFDDDGAATAGSVYVFSRDPDNNWVEQQKITAPAPVASATFGWSVSVDADSALVGAPGETIDFANEGAAYAYSLAEGSWTLDKRLTPADGGHTAKFFGFDVELDGDKAVLSAVGDNQSGTDAGAAYIFFRSGFSGWMEAAKILAPDGMANDNFGESISLSGKVVVIGAPGRDAGLAYVFAETDPGVWTPRKQLAASANPNGADLGFALSLAGNEVLVGAPGAQINGETSGAAYLFDLFEVAGTEIIYGSQFPDNFVLDPNGNAVGEDAFGPFTAAFGYFNPNTDIAAILGDTPGTEEYNEVLGNFTILEEINFANEVGGFEASGLFDLNESFPPAGQIAGARPAIWMVQGIENLGNTDFNDLAISNSLLMVQAAGNEFPSVNAPDPLAYRFGKSDAEDDSTEFFIGSAVPFGPLFFDLELTAAPKPDTGGGEVTAFGAGDIEIPNEDSTPEANDGTLLGSGIARGELVSSEFTVLNTGETPVFLRRATVNNAGFSIDFASALLQPGEAAPLRISFRSFTSGTVSAEVEIVTNQSNQPIYRFTVAAGVTSASVPATPYTVQTDGRNTIVDIRGEVLGFSEFGPSTAAFGYFDPMLDPVTILGADPGPDEYNALLDAFTILDQFTDASAVPGTIDATTSVDLTSASPASAGARPALWIVQGIDNLSAGAFSDPAVISTLLLVDPEESFPQVNTTVPQSSVFGQGPGSSPSVVIGRSQPSGPGFDLITEPLPTSSTDIEYLSNSSNFVVDAASEILGEPEFGSFTVAYGFYDPDIDLDAFLGSEPTPEDYNALFGAFSVLAEENEVMPSGAFEASLVIDVTESIAPAGPIAGARPAVWVIQGVDRIDGVDFTSPDVTGALLAVQEDQRFPAANQAQPSRFVFGREIGGSGTRLIVGNFAQADRLIDMALADFAPRATPIAFNVFTNNFVVDPFGNPLGLPNFENFTIALGYFAGSFDPAAVAGQDPGVEEANRLQDAFTVLAQVSPTDPDPLAQLLEIDVRQTIPPAGPIAGGRPALWLVEGINDINATDFSDPEIESTLLMVAANDRFPEENSRTPFTISLGRSSANDTSTDFIFGDANSAGGLLFDLQTESLPTPSDPGPLLAVFGNDDARIRFGADMPSPSAGTAFAAGVGIGETVSAEFTLRNIGTGTLEIGGISTGRPSEFQIVDFPASLAPGAAAPLRISFRANSAGERSTQLSIRTNQAGRPNFVFTIGAQVGFPSPVVENVRRSFDGSSYRVEWQVSDESVVSNYDILRATRMEGPYEVVNSNPVFNNGWTDPQTDPNETYFYIVRANAFDNDGTLIAARDSNPVQAPRDFGLSLSAAPGLPGQEATLAIVAGLAEGILGRNLNLILDFSEENLELASIERGSALGTVAFTTVQGSLGRVVVSGSSGQTTGRGPLFLLKFRLLDDNLNSSSQIPWKDWVKVTVDPGQGDGTVGVIGGTDLFGTNSTSTAIRFAEFGRADVDGDGFLTENDVTVLSNLLVAGEAGTDEQRQSGDLNGNGQLDLGDLPLVQLEVAGAPLPPSTLGGIYSLALPQNLEVEPNQEFTLSITANRTNGIHAALGQLNFNSDFFSFVRADPLPDRSPDTAMFFQEANPASVRFLLRDIPAAALGENENLLDVTFAVNAGVQGSIDARVFALAFVDLVDLSGREDWWTDPETGEAGSVTLGQGSAWIVASRTVDSDGDGLTDFEEQFFNGSPDYRPFVEGLEPGDFDLDFTTPNTFGNASDLAVFTFGQAFEARPRLAQIRRLSEPDRLEISVSGLREDWESQGLRWRIFTKGSLAELDWMEFNEPPMGEPVVEPATAERPFVTIRSIYPLPAKGSYFRVEIDKPR